MTVRSGLVRAATIVAVLTVVSKILGFAREASLAAVFGATHATDAYLVAQTIPGLIFAAVGAALGTTFVPVYARVRQERGQDAAFTMANSVINATVVLALAFVAFGEFFAAPLARLVAPGFRGPVYALTVWLSQVMFPMVLFQALSGLLSGLLQSEGNFTVPAGVGVGFNVIIIATVLGLGPRFGIGAVAAGTVAAMGIQVVWQWPALRRVGFHWRPTLNWGDPGLRRIGQLSGPVLVANSVSQIGAAVDRVLASGLTEGSVAALNYANRLMVLVPNIVGTAIVTVMYPTLARFSADGEWRRYTSSLGEAVRLINLMLVPVAVGIAVLREPVVRLAFERGAFDARATAVTAWALLFFAPAVAALTVRDMLTHAFFAFQDTKAPTVTAVLTVVLNILLNLLLVRTLKQGGLALAMSLALVVNSGMMFWALRKRVVRVAGGSVAGIGGWAIFSSFWRVSMASLVMGGAVWLSHGWLVAHLPGAGTAVQGLRLLTAVGVGAVVYVGLVLALRVPEASALCNTGREMLRKVLRRTIGEGC